MVLSPKVDDDLLMPIEKKKQKGEYTICSQV